jgi:hypothetical protein
MIDIRNNNYKQLTKIPKIGKLALIAGMFTVAFSAQVMAATATTSDGTISVTLNAPDTIVVGKQFVATVQVQNVTTTTIGIASATAQYARSAFKVQALSSPTSGAVCEKSTSNHGATGSAACGNVPLAPGETITTNVVLQSGSVGVLALGSYGFTGTGPFVQGTFTPGPSVTVNSVKK